MKAIILTLLIFIGLQKSYGQTKNQKNPTKSSTKKPQSVIKKSAITQSKTVEVIKEKIEIPIKKTETPIVNQNNESIVQPDKKTQSNSSNASQKVNTTIPSNNVIVSKSPKDKMRRSNENTFEIGLQGGMNSSTLTTNPSRSNNKVNLTGWNLGVIFNIPISKKLSLQPEINYTNHGLKYSYESDYEKLTMKYLELPLFLKYNIINGKTGKMYLQVGGYGGYWLAAELENNTNQEIIKEQYPFDNDVSDGFKDNRLDFGLLGGIGVAIKLGSGHFFIQSRYQHGLSDIAKFSTIPNDYTPSLHRNVSATIGYSFLF